MDGGAPRALTTRERDVLDAMIAKAGPGTVSEADRQAWRDAASNLEVVHTCECGQCPTIDFTHAYDEPCSFVEAAAGGLGIILFVRDGVPTCLEGYPIDGRTYREFPPVETITF